MAVGVLIGDILPVRGHEEALQGQEVIGVGEYGAKEVEVVIGAVGFFAGEDDLDAGPEGVIGGSDAVGI